MDPMEVPDLSNWVENLANRAAGTDKKGKVVGLAKFFFKYDLKNPDKRFHKLMRQCMVFYAFGIECAAKSWIVYVDDGKGKISPVIYSAILMDRAKDKWVVGLPEECWFSATDYDGEKMTGITISLKTADGVKSVYIRNP